MRAPPPQVVEPYISGTKFEHTPDWKYYARRLAQMAARVTEVYGWSEDDLLKGSQQQTLFGIDAPSQQKPRSKPAPKDDGAPAKKVSLDDFF